MVALELPQPGARTLRACSISLSQKDISWVLERYPFLGILTCNFLYIITYNPLPLRHWNFRSTLRLLHTQPLSAKVFCSVPLGGP